MPTLLFTDIESSTRLWEEHPAEMADALARHDSILQDSVSASGGTVLKTTGDGLVAVFDSVTDTVSAAIAAQTRLQSEDWGAVGSIRVRMGIHLGETESRAGDHFGPAMNRAARVMAAGHGGQVLLSQTAASTVAGGLPPDATLVDLGLHRLKDLTEPEHLYQVSVDGLATTFAPLRTLNSRPHNLPLQATEFHGRAAELEAISVMLESPTTRLLTITGPGGAGKTRLGLQVAAEHVGSFADGVFFVDLTAERDPAAAMEAIVRALDLVSGSGDDAIQVLESRLRDREMLLVLDNFEQVVSAGPAVAQVLQAAPGLKVLVTSREALRVRAERVYPIPPMSLPDPRAGLDQIAEAESVQLFVERARATRPDFVLDESNAETVADICLRLDGLPLAIELAAARLNVFAPTDLLQRLRQRLDVLGAGGRDLPDRQRTLWGAIGWSYELLDEDERRLVETISVFSSCDLISLEKVHLAEGTGSDVIGLLGSLIDKSLVRATSDARGGSRYGMLLMIREFAQERLEQDPERAERLRAAHAHCYSELALDLSERLGGQERETSLALLRLEIGNIRDAWRFWVDRGDIERLLGLIRALWALHEASGWYKAAIELANDALGVLGASDRATELAADELALRTSLARALLAVYGHGEEVERAFGQVLELAERSPDAKHQYPVLRALANYHMNLADYTPALDLAERLLELGETDGDQLIVIEANYLIGACTAFMGDLQKGLLYLDRAIEDYHPGLEKALHLRLGPNTAVVARIASGLLLWQAGMLDQAVARVTAGLAYARELDHPYSVAYALYHNGFLAVMRGRVEDIMTCGIELGSVSEENDYVLWGTLALILRGLATSLSGDPTRGKEMVEAGITDYQSLSTPPVFWPLVLTLHAMACSWGGEHDAALQLIDEAIAVAGADQEGIATVFWLTRGDVSAALPEPDLAAAAADYRRAIEMATTGGLKTFEIEGRNRLVAVNRLLGLESDGGDELVAVHDWFTEGHDEKALVTARNLLGIP